MTLRLITAPASEPVTLAEARLHVRAGTSEDALLTTLIQMAREQAEHALGRALISQTWEAVFDAFPEEEIELGKPDVQSIVSLTYYDTASVLQTMDSSLYTLDVDSMPGWVFPAYGTVWPSTLETPNAVRVRFTCGYGNASDVPAGIKAWMLLRIGTLYGHREEIAAGVTLMALPGAYSERLLDPYRVYA